MDIIYICICIGYVSKERSLECYYNTKIDKLGIVDETKSNMSYVL